MAGHATTHVDSATAWGGKVSPFNASYGKLMMWFFLVSDALTFGGLLVSYGFVRHATQGAWPIGEETFEALPFLGHGYPLVKYHGFQPVQHGHSVRQSSSIISHYIDIGSGQEDEYEGYQAQNRKSLISLPAINVIIHTIKLYKLNDNE